MDLTNPTMHQTNETGSRLEHLPPDVLSVCDTKDVVGSGLRKIKNR